MIRAFGSPNTPLSVAAAVALRANVPVAVASTLVTNPVTFGPIYYAAWRVGSTILGEPVDTAPPPPDTVTQDEPSGESWWRTTSRRVLGVGKPLLVGLADENGVPIPVPRAAPELQEQD